MGRAVLERLAAEPWPGRIVACRRDAERGAEACRLARVAALASGAGGAAGAGEGPLPAIEFERLDVTDPNLVADVVGRTRPDLVLLTMSLQTWWLPALLPEQAAAPFRGIGFGAWLPLHLPLVLAAMRSLAAAGYEGPILSAPFPDVTGPVLRRLCLAPTCGVGNVAEMVPKLRALAAERLAEAGDASATPADVEVTLVAHHALLSAAYRRQQVPAPGQVPPHHLRIRRGGRDVTEAVGAEELLLRPWPLPGGAAWASLTAACTVRLMRAVLSEGETRLHAPSPDGLPGGYPVLAGRGAVRPAPIEGLKLEEAVRLNERSHRFDGIERIEEDGTVVFAERVRSAMTGTLGFDCPRLAPDEAAGRGAELRERFAAYAARHGADLSAGRI
ncbi:MAG: hypothetical protein Q8W51_03425 [Candidatus Palauibacterales bacterium]|nr:hypothetical protein [Candidatus Palauibacterales bacterium]